MYIYLFILYILHLQYLYDLNLDSVMRDWMRTPEIVHALQWDRAVDDPNSVHGAKVVQELAAKFARKGIDVHAPNNMVRKKS